MFAVSLRGRRRVEVDGAAASKQQKEREEQARDGRNGNLDRAHRGGAHTREVAAGLHAGQCGRPVVPIATTRAGHGRPARTGAVVARVP